MKDKLKPDAVTTENGMKAFARLKVHAMPSTWQLLDRDEDKFTPEWAVNQSFDEWRKSLEKILPGVASVSMLRAHSSSARVLRPDGTAVGGGNGHVWIKISDASDAERTRAAIIAGALENGLAWPKTRFSKNTGEECGRGLATIIDPSVWTIGRLVFVGRPTCSGGLAIAPQQFENITGKDDALDTSVATFSPLNVHRASARQGVKMRMTPKKTGGGKVYGYASVMDNLTLDTEIELPDGGVTIVRELMKGYTDKVRCQAPFRASSSVAAFFALDEKGEPFVFDSGTDTTHVLAKPVVSRKHDKNRDKLIREVETRLGDLIGKDNVEAVLDGEVLRSAWDGCFYNSKGKNIAILNIDDELIELSVKDIIDFGFRRNFGQVFHKDFLDEVISEKKKLEKMEDDSESSLRASIDYLEHGPFIERLKLLKQAATLDVSVDIFATRGRMAVSDGIATIALPHRRFVVEGKFEKSLIDQVVGDYCQHFPEFPDFLGLVLHARFETDRRDAFVWLHSPSSWGKGFLLAIFAELGLVVETASAEIEKALAGGPVGLSMTNTLRAWILFVDEFKSASSDLKNLNKQISISPKNQLRCTVQLYAKLFASAENVRSLVGDGVESQFNNRFAYLSPSTHDQKIENRKLFKDLGKATYIGALVSYVSDYFNAGVDHLRAMGKIESSKVADEFVKAYQAGRRLQDAFGNLDDTVDDIVAEIRLCLIEYSRWIDANSRAVYPPDIVQGLGPQLLGTLKRTAVVGYVSAGEGSKQRHRAIVLGGAVPFVKSYLALSGDRSIVGKMQYKSDIIAEKLHMRQETYKGKVHVYRAAEKNAVKLAEKRGVVVFLDHQPASATPVGNNVAAAIVPAKTAIIKSSTVEESNIEEEIVYEFD
jgi:hypothetical protein